MYDNDAQFLQQWQLETIELHDGGAVIGPAFDVPYAIINVTECVQEILKRKDPLFQLHLGHNKLTCSSTALGRRLLTCLGTDWSLLKNTYPRHRFSPYLELFYEHATEAGLQRSDFCPSTVEQFNGLVDSIRRSAMAADFRRMVESQKRATRENGISLKTYIDNLFEENARILVVRVDLHFDKSFRTYLGTEINHHFVRHSFVRFLKRIQRKFPALIGYAKKMEYGPVSGFHYHVILFFNGKKVREDITIGEYACSVWREVTDGVGHGWNCNGAKHGYVSRGIGMIHYRNLEARSNLEKAAMYLVKIDTHVRLNLPRGWRVFTHGEVRRGQKRRSRHGNDLSRQIERLKSLTQKRKKKQLSS